MRSVVFTSGFLVGDDDLTTMKGHRSDVFCSDVFFRDDEGFCYELNFITLDRLVVEFRSSLEKGDNYFADVGLVILDRITKDSIVRAVRSLADQKFFSTQKGSKVKPESTWHVIDI